VNVQHDPDTILAAWLDEGPDRLPESTRRAIVVNARTTYQTRRRFWRPWRYQPMNGMSRFALAAVAVVAVALGGLYLSNSAPGSGVGGGPSPTPSPTPSPSPNPSALTESFTSAIHGISVSYPASWTVEYTATEPWTTGLPEDCEPTLCADQISAVVSGKPFLRLASQPLGGLTGEQWSTRVVNEPAFDASCPPAKEPVSIDGAAGKIAVICPDGILTALTWVDDRGYLIVLYGDDDKEWFKEILATVRLHPEDALVAPGSSPSGSSSPSPS
jgi:hypothetical protein